MYYCKLETRGFYTIVFSIHGSYCCNDRPYISISFNLYDFFYEYYVQYESILLIYEKVENRIESTIEKEIQDLNLREDINDLKDCIEEIKSYSKTVIKSLWDNAKNMQTYTFMTGEPLTISLYEKEDSSTNQVKRYDFNLMLEKYPTFWNEYCRYEKHFINTGYVFFIAEISKANDECWEFAITLSTIDYYNKRYYLAGRFKFIVKKGDTLNFVYYIDEVNKAEFKVTALITNVSRNKIELCLQRINNPFIQNISNQVWTQYDGWQ